LAALLLLGAVFAVGFLSGFAFTSMQLSASDSLLSDGIFAVGEMVRGATKCAGEVEKKRSAAEADKTTRRRLVAGTRG
jgi:hypothetical protein